MTLGRGGADADHESQEPVLSDDGRFLAFSSQASNLVARDTNGVRDVLVIDRDPDRDRAFDEGRPAVGRVSVTARGGQVEGRSSAPALSPNGRWVAFETESERLSLGTPHSSVILRDRDADRDRRFDERVGSRTILVSHGRRATADASSWSPAITPNGGWVAFASNAANLVPRDRNDRFDVFATGPVR